MGSSTLGHDMGDAVRRWPLIDRRGLRLWSIVFLVRAAGFTALGIAALLVPAVGDDRYWIALLLLVAVTPYNLALTVDLRRHHRLHPSTVFLDVIGASILHVWFDGVWTPVLLVALASVALAAVGFDRRLALWVTAVGTVSFGIAGAWRDTPSAIVGVLTFMIAAVMVVLTVGIVADSERQARLRFTGLVEGVDAVVWEIDLEALALTYVSPSVEGLFGYPPEDLYVPGFFASCIHPDDLLGVLGDGQGTNVEDDEVQMEFRVIRPDGRVVWVRNFMRGPRASMGSQRIIRGVLVDISGQKADEQLIAQYSDIVENMQVGLLVWQLTDRDEVGSLRLLAGNPAAWALLGRSGESLVGGAFGEVFPELSGSDIADRVAGVIRRGEPEVIDQVDYVSREQERAAMFLRVFPLPNECAGFAFEDVTTQMEVEEELRHQALHDNLTGLPNRALFNERLGWVLTEGARRGTSVVLLLIDLDQFKEVNDTLGHLVGDELLRQVSQRLRLLLRESDTIARIGGDEFAVLLTTAADETASREVAAKIGAAFAEPFRINGIELRSSPSIGIAVFPDHGTDQETLVQRADVAMYAAKRSGSGFAFYVADDDRRSMDRIKLLGEIHHAVDHDELVVYYQPKIALGSGDVVDIEALVRWRHPEQGLLRPSAFIELAELSGAVQGLARQVIDTGLHQHGLWSSLDLGVGLAVNLSIRNLYDPTLADYLDGEFKRRDVDPREVVIEVTERDLMDDPAQVGAALGRLTDLGMRLAIDDFGTGSFSLANLREFPVSELKIDRSFVGAMLSDHSSEVIVRSIIDLGHNLGLSVVAEGVESVAVLDRLIDLGCDHAQGFQICEPLLAEELLEWLEVRGGPRGWGVTRT
ncbi:MAG: EAL domain-containing protein [Acidimicrobiales bacterium]